MILGMVSLMSQTEKRFDNWENVDCVECANYWTNACDGVSEGQRKPCNSFIAQRSVTIPAEIKSLRSELRDLKRGFVITTTTETLGLLLILIWQIVNWW